MKWIFNTMMIRNDIEIFYSFISLMVICIIIAFVLVLKELKNSNDD